MVQHFENETMKEPYKLLNGENAFGDHSILLSRSQHYVRYEIFMEVAIHRYSICI